MWHWGCLGEAAHAGMQRGGPPGLHTLDRLVKFPNHSLFTVLNPTDLGMG